MKLIINENQYENLMGNLAHKKLFFKYWDKFGGTVDENFFKLFGFKHNRLDNINQHEVYRYLAEWIGEEKAFEKFKSLVENNPHTIDNCGGYDFEYDLEISEFDQSTLNVFLNVTVKPGGQVELIMVGGDIMDISDAIRDEEIGSEIESEIQECIYDDLINFTNQTGITSVIMRITYP
jgi:hypothetical protein